MLTKVRQQGPYDCGVACAATVTRNPYEKVRKTFDVLGLGESRERPYRSNFAELQRVLTHLGVASRRRRFAGWSNISGIAIVKTNVRPEGHWHWIAVERHAEHGIVVHDPATDLPTFEHLPREVLCISLDRYQPEGCYIQLVD